MKLKDLKALVDLMSSKYDGETEVEFLTADDEVKMGLTHVNFFREITVTLFPSSPDNKSTVVDTIFMVFG